MDLDNSSLTDSPNKASNVPTGTKELPLMAQLGEDIKNHIWPVVQIFIATGIIHAFLQSLSIKFYLNFTIALTIIVAICVIANRWGKQISEWATSAKGFHAVVVRLLWKKETIYRSTLFVGLSILMLACFVYLIQHYSSQPVENHTEDAQTSKAVQDAVLKSMQPSIATPSYVPTREPTEQEVQNALQVQYTTPIPSLDEKCEPHRYSRISKMVIDQTGKLSHIRSVRTLSLHEYTHGWDEIVKMDKACASLAAESSADISKLKKGESPSLDWKGNFHRLPVKGEKTDWGVGTDGYRTTAYLEWKEDGWHPQPR